MTSDRPTPVPKSAALCGGLALVHLTFVAVFVSSQFEFVPAGDAMRAIQTYGNVTGVFRDYGFFAPNVSAATKAGFLVYDREQDDPTLIPLGSDNRELELRYHSLIAFAMYDERAQDLFAQSWAAAVLARRPQSERVIVMVRALELPTMEAYRAGERPEWKARYVSEFARRRP